MADSTFGRRARLWFYARPVFRAFDWACNYGAWMFEGDRSLAKPGLRASLAELNERRSDLQRRLSVLTASHGDACAECKGRCCSEERFRDAFIDRVLQDPDTANRAPRSRKKADREHESAYPPLRGLAKPHEFPKDYCPNCTTEGCRISYEQRPIQCTAFYCRKSIALLSAEECETGVDALRGLMGVLTRTALLAASSRAADSGRLDARRGGVAE